MTQPRRTQQVHYYNIRDFYSDIEEASGEWMKNRPA